MTPGITRVKKGGEDIVDQAFIDINRDYLIDLCLELHPDDVGLNQELEAFAAEDPTMLESQALGYLSETLLDKFLRSHGYSRPTD